MNGLCFSELTEDELIYLTMSCVPWRLVKSWRCLSCGSCCRRYVVNLTWEEYRKIIKFWPGKVRIKDNKPYLGRKTEGDCEFLSGNLCYLQMLDMKPLACKVWPFIVLLKPDKMDKNFDGLYQTTSKEYFVYLNPRCLGINKGNPVDFKRTIDEVINLWNGLKKEQYYSTNKELILGNFYLYNKDKTGINFIPNPKLTHNFPFPDHLHRFMKQGLKINSL